MAVRKVTVIPSKTRREIYNAEVSALERVCAYCRVSTDSEEQESSYDLQVKHYTDYINKKPEWQFVDIYADEGISGKSTKYRKEFLRMIADCKKGKIDKIITKSISRFARNARDCKDYVMQLKELGISVFFEKENLDSMQAGSDLVLSILSSMAEQESRDISTNLKWTWKKKFAKGEVMLNTTRFLGYTKDEDKKIVIVPEEAEIVRRIYREFISGKTYNEIARGLEKDNIISPGGVEKWHSSTISSILTNEKYKGDAILQKTYSVDFLSKRQKNIGQAEMYEVKNSHPAIISRDVADMASAEIEKRKNIRGATKSGHGKYSSKYPFSGVLICGNCNSKYRRHSQWSGDKKTPIWVCTLKQNSHNNDCQALPIKEVVLEQAFVECMRRLLENKDEFIKTLVANISECVEDNFADDLGEIDNEVLNLQTKLVELNREHRNGKIEKADYIQQYDILANNLEKLMEQRNLVNTKCEMTKSAKTRMQEMQKFLDNIVQINTFNKDLFTTLVEHIRVMSKHNIIIEFKCGFTYEMDI